MYTSTKAAIKRDISPGSKTHRGCDVVYMPREMESRLDWYTGENSGLWLGERPTYAKHERLRFFSHGNFRRPRDTYVKRKCCRFFSFEFSMLDIKVRPGLVTYCIAVMLQMATRYGVTTLFATRRGTYRVLHVRKTSQAFFSRGIRCSGNKNLLLFQDLLDSGVL